MKKLTRSYGGEQASDYAKNLTACQCLDDLRALVTEYRELALDAFDVVSTMTADDWPTFLRGLKSERRGKYAGDDWCARFGAVLMPLPMMRIAIIAQEYSVPFGVAWIHCKEHRPDLLTVEGPLSPPAPDPQKELSR